VNGRLHVVGAGIAGLAAALAATRAGHAVTLYEATQQAGGRCRAVEDGTGAASDNGTHVLLGANRHALRFLEAIDARESWVEPEPDGLPVLDLATGEAHRIGLSPWSWLRPAQRPPGLGLGQLARLIRLGLPGPDRSVASVMGEGTFTRALIAPLTVAALNTPPEEASANRLARVLRRVLLPGSARLLVARRGLGPDLIEPALRALDHCGVVPAFGHRLRRLQVEGGQARKLAFGDQDVTLRRDDRVVLALPTHALARLLPDLDLPQRFDPIVNLHFPIGAGTLRFVGLLGGLAQWVLFRPGMASVTISAARTAVDLPAAELAARTWPEVQRAAASVGLQLPGAMPACRVVKERRATISQSAGLRLRVPRQPYSNVTLGGDWLTPLPATIEAAVASGTAAAGAPLVHARATTTSPVMENAS
jgi:hypothetical protein